MIRLPRARLQIVWIVLLTMCVAAVSVFASRHSLLRATGWLLVVADPSEPADVIVVAADAGREGVLDAADLVHAGVAARVAVFSDPLHVADREFIKRGVPYFYGTSLALQQLHALGVDKVEQIPPPAVAGTEDEARQLPQWCLTRGFHTVVIVSAPDHSRRVRRVLARTTHGLSLKFIVRPSRYSDFDPDTWWLTRGGARTALIELEKLGVEIMRHPLA